ncbi:unnamed protein product [Amoebophrya sp. A120]|nr:unnamed protein product [Amoebophrya sp. A120]|eukprot:GSA120T00025654001.1
MCFKRKNTDLLRADDKPEQVQQQVPRVMANLTDNVFANYAPGVLDVHSEKRLQPETPPADRADLIRCAKKRANAKKGPLWNAAANFLTEYIAVCQANKLELKDRNKYLLQTVKLSFNKMNGIGQEVYKLHLDAAIQQNLVETKLFGNLPELMREDPMFNELYYVGYDLFAAMSEKAKYDVDEDKVDDFFDWIIFAVGLGSARLDTAFLDERLDASEWVEL